MRHLDDVCVVVPTIGRDSLSRLLAALARQSLPVGQVVIVDDRGSPGPPLPVPAALTATVVTTSGRGPAAARNAGWQASDAAWIVFLDDDVEPSPSWSVHLAGDLAVDPEVGGTQGRIVVPLPTHRRPTDRERGVARLAEAEWITADLALRHDALEDVDGFDERFRRAYREDSDLALRLMARGWRLVHGERLTQHPVRSAPWWSSVAAQRGNRDDALMRALHGRGWRLDRGRRPRHAAITGAGLVAAALATTGHHRLAAVTGGGWLLGTAEFAAARIASGPRTAREVTAMLATSVLIPPVAIAWWTIGRIAHPSRRTRSWPVHQRLEAARQSVGTQLR